MLSNWQLPQKSWLVNKRLPVHKQLLYAHSRCPSVPWLPPCCPQATSNVLRRLLNLEVDTRLGLLGPKRDSQEFLMFECGAPHGTADPRATPAARRRPPSPSCGDSTASRRGCAGASCGTGALLAVDPDREMTVLQMPLRGTLLARAVSGGGGWECLVGCMRRRQPCGWSCSVCADGVCPGLLCTSLHPRACIAALYLSDAAAHRCWQPRSLQRRRPALLTTQPPTSRTLGGWSGGQELGLLRRRLRMQMNRLSAMR